MKTESFGVLSTGEPISHYTLRNGNCMIVSIVNLGATITRLEVRDREGNIDDVVAGFSDLASYEVGKAYFGAIIGRIAGRLSGGKIIVDGKAYSLELNDPPNHLHGGNMGFDKRVWKMTQLEESLVELYYRSPSGEEGYPGNLDIWVTYQLSSDNELIISYRATTDQTTPISLTNHSWFNLGGEGNGTILDHELEIYSDFYTPTDEQMTLLGTCESVEGTESDFRKPRKLGNAIPRLLNSHGDNYIFPDSDKKSCRKVARLRHERSGRIMEVYTTERCLQFYGGKALDGTLIGKSGRAYLSHGALCLECQGYPDGPNHPELENTLLKLGETYRQKTKYVFSTE